VGVPPLAEQPGQLSPRPYEIEAVESAANRLEVRWYTRVAQTVGVLNILAIEQVGSADPDPRGWQTGQVLKDWWPVLSSDGLRGW
jgi:hypothetical protein